ncbi:unnamed protein product [Ectocarpus sp. 8 AP-2014]
MMASITSSVLDDNKTEHKRRLRRKLIYSVGLPVAAVVAEIVVGHLIIEVASTLTAVDDWGADTREAMIKLEQVFFERKSQISRAVLFSSLISALLLIVMACIMGVTARFVAGGIVGSINQLIYVVHALNRMDFSRQAPGTWMEARDSENPDHDTWLREIDELLEASRKRLIKAVEFDSTPFCKQMNVHVMNFKLALAFVDTLCPATKIAAEILHWDSQTTKSQKKRLRRRVRLRLRLRLRLFRRRNRRRRNRRRRRRRPAAVDGVEINDFYRGQRIDRFLGGRLALFIVSKRGGSRRDRRRSSPS